MTAITFKQKAAEYLDNLVRPFLYGLNPLTNEYDVKAMRRLYREPSGNGVKLEDMCRNIEKIRLNKFDPSLIIITTQDNRKEWARKYQDYVDNKADVVIIKNNSN